MYILQKDAVSAPFA